MNFAQRLRRIQRANRSLLCVGLDTDVEKIPRFHSTHKDPIYEFNRQIVHATKDLVCAYKLNFAFYEAQGERGMASLRKTLARIPRDIITIGDTKRGDIGNTAVMYARVLFDQFQFSACTVNPYMGTDSVEPFTTEGKTCSPRSR